MGGMAKKVTLRDVADQLGVSQNTVSVALRGLPGISESKRREICLAAREMGYEVRKRAPERTRVCLVTPYSGGGDTYFFTGFLQEISSSLQAAGCETITLGNMTHGQLETLREICAAKELRGIIIVGTVGRELAEEILGIGKPVVCAGFYLPGLMVDSVLEDDISGVLVAVEELIRRGYRRYAFIGDIRDQGFFHRWMALGAALFREGLLLLRESCFTEHDTAQLSDPVQLSGLLEAAGELPEIFLCANDKIAMAAMKALRHLDLQVPRDVGVLGFDNSDLAGLCIPSLATVDNFVRQQADGAARRLLARIDDPGLAVQRILTPVKFIPGDSIRPLG